MDGLGWTEGVGFFEQKGAKFAKDGVGFFQCGFAENGLGCFLGGEEDVFLYELLEFGVDEEELGCLVFGSFELGEVVELENLVLDL